MTEALKIGFDVKFHEAILAAAKRDVVLPEAYYGELQGLARQLAFSIAGIAAYDQLETVRDSMTKALEDGQSFAKWKKNIIESGANLGLPDHRLDNIFRTNIQNSYNRGRWQKYQNNKLRRPYLMYDAINDSRVRPTHLAMDGIIREVDDGFWHEHAPSNGFRCRCRLISLSEKQAQQRSGNDKGLNKRIDGDAMKPDKGWEYNPGADQKKGIDKAITDRTGDGNDKVQASLGEKLTTNPAPPVSQSLDLPKRSGVAKRAVAYVNEIIDAIHGDGELPRIPVKNSSDRSFQGQYSYFTFSGKPVEIKVSTRSVNPELTAIHEIGHFIDHQGFGIPGKYASINDPLFNAWRDAVKNSAATKRLEDLLKNANDLDDRDRAKYYLSEWEQWARSYAQWVALKSGDQKLIDQVNNIINYKFSDTLYKASQWTEEDFKAIGESIDEIFNKLGWLK